MSMLTDALTASLENDVRFENWQHPSSVVCCTVPVERFAEAAKVLKKAYALLAAEWTTDEIPFGRGFGVFACYRWGSEYLIVRAELSSDDPRFPSLTKKYVPAYRFERQIHSLMGVKPSGHPDMRPWIKFEDWPQDAFPLRKTFEASKPLPRVKGEYQWARADGEGIYEIPVGPVHAGVIEPGHFRFQAVGEMVVNLEERLGYVHKGIEKLFESLPWKEGGRLAGRISGDTTVAHSIAYSMAVESMAGGTVPERAHWLRALFLERERIANHFGDIGAICNDAAFAFMLYQLARLRELMLRTNHRLFGHRFIMDRVFPGGVTADIDNDGKREILFELDTVSREFERLVVIYDENSSLEDRVRDTGVLAPEKARELCAVGIVARASGLNLDCRLQNPFPPYDRIELNVPVLISGDVHARVWVRVEEIRESIRLIRYILENIPDGSTSTDIVMPSPDSAGFATVEGWRGEIVCWIQAGPRGEINRCMVRDPSSVNWLGLEQAIPGDIVPDFPLCNKSFNQSYSGHDL
ncbi:MAG TPA: NADH-quinone oxidoreductase subunit C [Thermodesulfovibrionales bacterium]|nr:NADH-quinone oxidoreductase subunit C [Thermodesulfovibrionales bacterium]